MELYKQLRGSVDNPSNIPHNNRDTHAKEKTRTSMTLLQFVYLTTFTDICLYANIQRKYFDSVSTMNILNSVLSIVFLSAYTE